jgi:hypothetical protein
VKSLLQRAHQIGLGWQLDSVKRRKGSVSFWHPPTNEGPADISELAVQFLLHGLRHDLDATGFAAREAGLEASLSTMPG